VTFAGEITKVDCSSSYPLVHGYWDLVLDLHSSNGKSLTGGEHDKFDSGFITATVFESPLNRERAHLGAFFLEASLDRVR
jgi:hypothetical protein